VERIVINDVSDGTSSPAYFHSKTSWATRSLRSDAARAIPSCSPSSKKSRFFVALKYSTPSRIWTESGALLKQQSEEVEEEEEDDEEDEKS